MKSKSIIIFVVVVLIGVAVYLYRKWRLSNDQISEPNTNPVNNGGSDNAAKPAPTSPSNSTPVIPKSAFIKGQKVTVLKGENLRSTNSPYGVVRTTASAESGWTLVDNPYRNTIEGNSGTWAVIYKDVIVFSSPVFVPNGEQSKATQRMFHVVSTGSIS